MSNPNSVNASNPQPTRSPRWLLPVVTLFVVVVGWVIFRGRPDNNSTPIPIAPAPTPPTSAPQPVARISPTPLAPGPNLSAAPLTPDPAEAVVITPELRQERLDLLAKLEASNDTTLEAVRKALAAHGIKQPEATASAWILAQNWAISARAEALVNAKIEDENTRNQLAESRRRILIQSATREIQGLLDAEPDPNLLAQLESLGRGLKDLPPPSADLLPDRAAGAARRNASRPRSDLPPEE